MKNYTDKSCVDFVGAAFKRCLTKTKNIEEINNRLHFVNKGDLFKLWCVVTEQDEQKLRNIVIVKNHKITIELEKNGTHNKSKTKQ